MAQDTLVDSITLTLAGSASISLNHNIGENGVRKIPDLVMPTKATGIVVSGATSTQVSFTNPTAGSLTATFYVQRTLSQQMPEVPVNQYWAGTDSSGGSTGTLQQSYDAGGVGQQTIALGGAGRTGMAVRDNATPLGSDLFEITNSGDTLQYLGVDVNGAKTDMGMTLVNSTVGVGPAGGVRLRSSGAVLQVSQGGGAYANVLHAGENTLSSSYAAGSAGVQTMTLDATRLGVALNDAANVGGDLFAVTDGTNPWLAVRNNAVRIGADTIQFRELPGAGPFSLAVVTPAAANTAGYPLTVGSGAGSDSDNSAVAGAGATMTISGGAGGAGAAARAAGAGGAVAITAGTAGAGAGGGGGVGGSVTITAGGGTVAAAHGDINLVPGAGTATSTTPGKVLISVVDVATATATDVLVLSHTSTGTAAASYGTAILFRGQDSAGTAGGDDIARISARWTSAASGAEYSTVAIQTRNNGSALADAFSIINNTGGGATKVVAPTSAVLGLGSSATNSYVLSIASNRGLLSVSGAASIFGETFSVAGTAATSGAHVGFLFSNTMSNTGQTASTEIIGFSVLGITRQWATGAITTQREHVFAAPTYSFVGASTVTTTATVAIPSAPIAGTNATFTNSYAFWVQADQSRFDGRVIINTPNSAIADGNLVASSISWYLNEAGNLLVAKAKYADGTTIKTFSGALV